MTDSRDHELSRLYREGAWPEPGRQLDEAILEASRRARAVRRSKSLVWRFGPPFALAAALVLAFSLLLRMNQEMPGEKIAAPAARRAPPAPRIVRPVEEPKPVAEAATPNPEVARPPGLVQEPPPAAPALKKEIPFVTRADQLQRQPDVQQRLREASQPRGQFQAGATHPPAQAYTPALTTPVAPTAGSSTASGAGVSGPLAGRPTVPVERSPETWLEDIRKLKAQGRSEEAQRELAEFRRRYAVYRLPDDLR